MTLITLKDPHSPAAEAYRTLRSNILFAGVEKPIHTLLISSPMPGEGKSLTAANLAVVLAQSGQRVLLVDADLRRPSQHTLWNLPNERGLSSAMLDASQLATPPLQATHVENLSVLTAGPTPPNPADLMISKQMNALIEALARQADTVLFDAPPILVATDAPLLASKLDGLLLVIKAGTTRRDHAERAKEILERAHVRVIGAVLNNAPKDSAAAGGY